MTVLENAAPLAAQGDSGKALLRVATKCRQHFQNGPKADVRFENAAAINRAFSLTAKML
ncbi:MAG: hypothetical protein I8H86_02190 [Sphingomonadaceae bacterium]|nr:hypothetical protein [Sphingomonadaceae bacterium]MBH1998877.1 hypothetical protein [Sphingomonadaceae bacterium]